MAAVRKKTGFEFGFKSRVSPVFLDVALSADRAYLVTSRTERKL
jgi:hypothetical protein